MKQTAVEWLISKIEVNSNPSLTQKEMIGYIEQAKEMERQQIVDAGSSCALKMRILIDKIEKMTDEEIQIEAENKTETLGEQYYNEIHKETYTEDISPDWKGDPNHPNRWDGW